MKPTSQAKSRWTQPVIEDHDADASKIRTGALGALTDATGTTATVAS